ncbi:MAG TPA: hypothetical protein VF807_09395 [Ktedonobacterales bacterium]
MDTIPSWAPPQAADVPVPRPPRVWPGVLVLFLLAPLLGEVLSGSTPPVDFITNPINFIFQPLLYGSGAILARELVRRRSLGWWRIILLGAAYGIFEEGLVVTSWFNPYWPDLWKQDHNFGRALGIAWPWAVGLTAYHAIVSITISIVLVETLFPRIAAQPWLNRRGVRLFEIILGAVWVVGFIGFGIILAGFQSKGAYHGPPLSYALAIALAAAFVWLGLRPARAARDATVDDRPVPGLWLLRGFGLLATVAFFVVHFSQGSIFHMAQVEIAVVLVILALAAWRVTSWARRSGWGARQRLALATGAMSFFILLAPIVAMNPSQGKATWSLLYAAPVWVAFLIFLARRARRTELTHERPTLPVYGASQG